MRFHLFSFIQSERSCRIVGGTQRVEQHHMPSVFRVEWFRNRQSEAAE